LATRLRRLKIDQFRDVRPGTELRFGEGWNVLVGRNGSGKTTLLNLISMVLRDDLTALQGEAFAIEYELEVDRAARVEPEADRGFEQVAKLPDVGAGVRTALLPREVGVEVEEHESWRAAPVEELVRDVLRKAHSRLVAAAAATAPELHTQRMKNVVPGVLAGDRLHAAVERAQMEPILGDGGGEGSEPLDHRHVVVGVLEAALRVRRADLREPLLHARRGLASSSRGALPALTCSASCRQSCSSRRHSTSRRSSTMPPTVVGSSS